MTVTNFSLAFFAQASALALGVVLSSCDTDDAITTGVNELANTALQVTSSLDGAISGITENSERWQEIIQGTIDDLPAAEQQVRQDLENLLATTVAIAGTEFKCSVKYLGQRLVEQIKAIKAKLLGNPPPTRLPVTCGTSPSGAIDMAIPQNRRKTLSLYGYNLMSRVSMEHNIGGKWVDVSDKLFENSDYQLTANLSANGVVLDSNSNSIRFSHDGNKISEIPIVHPFPEVCDSGVETFSPNPITVIPQKESGDIEWGGNGPCVEADVRVSWSSSGGHRHIAFRADVKMWECNSNFSQRNDSKARDIRTGEFLSHVGAWDKTAFISPSSAKLKMYTGHRNQLDTLVENGGGLVSSWLIKGDTLGNDVGKSRVTISFNPFKFSYEQTGNCIPESRLASVLKDKTFSGPTFRNIRKNPRIIKKLNLLRSREVFFID